MIIEPVASLCNDLLVIPLKDGTLDISWELNTNNLKELLSSECDKILNLHENLDFDIQIDNVNTFDSINLKTINFSNITDKYIGNIVFSAIIDFNKNQFEETTYFIRIKIRNSEMNCQVINSGNITFKTIQINDSWSNILEFKIPKNYTKDIVEIMYKVVADSNSYNKEVRSANFYYLFQAFAYTLNKEYHSLLDIKSSNFLYKSKPDYLINSFGQMFKFTDVNNISMEEYRRVLIKLIIGYQNGGAWNYIKEILQYFVGYYPDLTNFSNFYPWILRTKELLGITQEGTEEEPINYAINDPTNFSDRNYYNPESGYYVYEQDFIQNKDNNLILLLGKNFKKFTFIVKSDNFFNRNIDIDKIKTTLNILKSAYTKYTLNIEEQIELSEANNAIMANDDEALLLNDDNYISFI